MFTNPNIQSTIYEFNGTSFCWLFGFGMYSSFDIVYYYIMDYGASKVFILSDEWSFIASKSSDYPTYMISIDNSLYMIGYFNIWKVDQDLNILIQYNPGGDSYYGGISYNPSNGLIYAAAASLKEIQVFN